MEKKVEPADIASRDAVNDIEYRVKRAKSACRDPFERRAQRWFIDSFIDAGFVLKRHEASDAVMRVFGITPPLALTIDFLVGHMLHRLKDGTASRI